MRILGLAKKMRLKSTIVSLIIASLAGAHFKLVWAESTCYGTPGRGRIEGAVQLPEQGANYIAHSNLGVALGRTYVHDKVREIIVSAYSALAVNFPEKVFVYGETGWKSGGTLKPHRTHQNGLSVDFFVPVTNSSGKSVPMPINALNKFGYGIEFDTKGQFEDFDIDLEAMGEHLYQLKLAAQKVNAPISLVIFEPSFLPRLFSTSHGKYLEQNIPFMKGKPWVRHDEHYHVDFDIVCKSLPK